MSNFYSKTYNFYLNTYWDKPNSDFLKANGFTTYPFKEYDYFVDIINKNDLPKCDIIDICCGNGMLLRHLMENCHSQITPFGIDFLNPSIEQAKKEVLPDFRRNFFVSNAVDFDFSNHIFDIVLLDPYHFIDIDLVRILPIIMKQTRNSIIFYTYADVLRQTKLDSVANFPTLKSITNLEMFNYNEISIAVFYC